MTDWHVPVLTSRVVELLNCRAGGIYVDATVGGGGWAEAILESIRPNGILIGFDRDATALEESRRRLKKFGESYIAVHAEFSAFENEIKKLGIDAVDGVAADLGVSSHQLDTTERGFSFLRSAGLDMRMNREGKLTAYDLVNTGDEKQLADWFFEFGDERFSRRIARAIINERKKSPIETTGELAEIVARAVPGKARRGRIHPATRVFQALRIVVNDEMNELQALLGSVPKFLKSGGRFVVVSYHSLEDRLVKRSFLSWAEKDDFVRITKKPIRPEEDEISQNRRARSARLRVLGRK